MPAVRLDAGYLSNPGDAARLCTSEFRDAIAEAVVAALRLLYVPDNVDMPTAERRVPALVR
jgi:N-acetylmuramoyl-L-alanine amidase